MQSLCLQHCSGSWMAQNLSWRSDNPGLHMVCKWVAHKQPPGEAFTYRCLSVWLILNHDPTLCLQSFMFYLGLLA